MDKEDFKWYLPLWVSAIICAIVCILIVLSMIQYNKERKKMIHQKVEITLPIDKDDEKVVEFNAHPYGYSMNILIDGTVAYTIDLNEELVLKVALYPDEETLFKKNLMDHYRGEA